MPQSAETHSCIWNRKGFEEVRTTLFFIYLLTPKEEKNCFSQINTLLSHLNISPHTKADTH